MHCLYVGTVAASEELMNAAWIGWGNASQQSMSLQHWSQILPILSPFHTSTVNLNISRIYQKGYEHKHHFFCHLDFTPPHLSYQVQVRWNNMEEDWGQIVFLVNTSLTSCNTEVQQDTEKVLKWEYMSHILTFFYFIYYDRPEFENTFVNITPVCHPR